jgi:hypothetical protein
MRLDLLAVLLTASVGAGIAGQLPVPFEPPRQGPDQPVNDPVVVRGCVDGHTLRILRDDTNELFGIRVIRLKGPKGVMAMLKDHAGGYVEVSGVVDLGRPDRIETRKKAKLGKDGKGGTITLAASSEQTSGDIPLSGAPVLRVVAIAPLGERCPGRAGL